MYARDVGDRVLTFGVSGKLIQNALVMYDRETDSLWSQFLGYAVRGDFEGTKLGTIGSSLVTWEEWRARYPETEVLDQGGRRGDPYGGYYRNNSAGVLGESVRDDRLGRKEFVVGVQWGDSARAYPFRALNDEPVRNDHFEGRDIVVVFGQESADASVYSRDVDGRALTFEIAYGELLDAAGAAVPMRDLETGSLWDGRFGTAVSGPLAGTQLEELPSLTVFWFAWTDFYPRTELFEPAG